MGWGSQLILSANSPGGSFGRKLRKMRRAGQAKPRFAGARDEFADSISYVGESPEDAATIEAAARMERPSREKPGALARADRGQMVDSNLSSTSIMKQFIRVIDLPISGL